MAVDRSSSQLERRGLLSDTLRSIPLTKAEGQPLIRSLSASTAKTSIIALSGHQPP